MENITRYNNGESAIDIWGATTKFNGIAEPTPEDLKSAEFQDFLALVLEDALGTASLVG